MQLLVTNIQPDDFTLYNCVSKNVKETVEGSIILYEEYSGLSYTKLGKTNTVTFGNQCLKSKVLTKTKEGTSGTNFKATVFEYGTFYDLLPKKREKPKYVHTINQYFGAWMVDVEPRYSSNNETVWVTNDDICNSLDCNSKEDLVLNKPYKTNRSKIPAWRFETHLWFKLRFFSVDKNGLWVIFTTPYKNNTAVIKVSRNENVKTKRHLGAQQLNTPVAIVTPKSEFTILSQNILVLQVDIHAMKPQYIFDVTLNNSEFDDMFVAYGTLYGIGNFSKNSKLFAVDLYSKKVLNIDSINEKVIKILKKSPYINLPSQTQAEQFFYRFQ
ncbi:hypothetical protein ILUMI_06471 [Ignelater luminosus]|uniref:Uncharacterized protein n=1 Tax=Ignelater luminosus TaxID=2038154 RepID=A0A8K0D8C5_IGNLU|nr:hypothetical protein ILUMI_06471 [Ignelater luminosus]